jgi:hypothetical protein
MKLDQDGPLSADTTSTTTEEEREDFLDDWAVAEAMDEALDKGRIKKTRDFAKELGFDF